MKGFILLLAFSFSIFASASTDDYLSFTYSGDQNNQSFELSTEKTHTEYRYEQRAKTCYRQVLVGHDRRCHWEQVPVCRINNRGRRVCYYEDRRVCRSYPIYRREAYTCYERVTIPFEVFDYFVDTNVHFNFEHNQDSSVAPLENFVFGITGDSDYLRETTSGKFLIYARQSRRLTGAGERRSLDISYNMRLEEIAGNFTPVLHGITQMNVSGEELYFEMGDFTSADPLEIRLKVKRKKFGSDPVLMNRVLNVAEYTKQSLNDSRARVRIDLAELLPKMKFGKKHEITVTIRLRKNIDEVINRSDIPKLSHSREITIK
ncbi:hypothetical protein A9Q84_18070 [Halobacteriovorax marinus]|uniref:Secreted protein n=1 Tax=Halobacteriovorax marinus TaxID=97084 RepID=A0A1Y5F7B9_9BACT|nr:hypothetical protein A9Q84_18070 [Halobacteriovorax marinus]